MEESFRPGGWTGNVAAFCAFFRIINKRKSMNHCNLIYSNLIYLFEMAEATLPNRPIPTAIIAIGALSTPEALPVIRKRRADCSTGPVATAWTTSSTSTFFESFSSSAELSTSASAILNWIFNYFTFKLFRIYSN